MHFPHHRAEIHLESSGNDDLVGSRHVGELGVRFRAHILKFNRVYRMPGLAITVKHQVEQALDNALLSLGEIPALCLWLETAISAEQAIHHQEDQNRVEYEERSAAQWLDVHQVQIAWHRKVTHEFAEFDDFYGAGGDVRAAPHEIEQAQAQKTRKALIDDFERRHAPTHDPFLRCQIIGTKTRGRGALLTRWRAVAYPFEQRVYLFLG